MEEKAKKNNLTQFLKGSSILVISNVCLKAMNFFLLPLYTKHLSTDQLGISDSISNLTSLLFPILTLGLDSAFSAFYFEKKDPDRGKRVYSTLSVTFFILGLVAAMLSVTSGALSRMLFHDTGYQGLVVLAFISLAINLWYLPLSLELRMKNRMLAFGIANLSASLAMILLNILFVVVLHFQEWALILSSLLSGILQLLILFLFVRRVPKREEIDKRLLRGMLRFSIPLVPMSILNWVLAISDRYVLLFYHGEGTVGVYGVAMRFVTVLNVVISAVAMAYTTFAFQTKDDEDAKKNYYYIFQTESMLLLIICFTISLFGKELIMLMSSDEAYYTACEPLRDLMFAQSVFAMSNVVGYGINFAKKSVYYLIAVSAGVALNLGLNFALVPQYGMQAAALTTLLGYLVVFILTYIFSERLYPCRYGVLRSGIALAALYAACFFLDDEEFWLRLCVWLLLTGLVLILFRDIIKKLARFLMRRLRRH
ncbi:MAG: oligosaccharide flippase family protein [Eubacterium sp.]|nr:oligosaccharide flippase family protein [Eubacterium sp.]